MPSRHNENVDLDLQAVIIYIAFIAGWVYRPQPKRKRPDIPINPLWTRYMHQAAVSFVNCMPSCSGQMTPTNVTPTSKPRPILAKPEPIHVSNDPGVPGGGWDNLAGRLTQEQD